MDLPIIKSFDFRSHDVQESALDVTTEYGVQGSELVDPPARGGAKARQAPIRQRLPARIIFSMDYLWRF